MTKLDRLHAAILWVSLALGCRRPAAVPTVIPKFDVHTHLAPDGIARAAGLLRAQGIVGAVNLSGGNTPEQLSLQLAAARTVPGFELLTFANLDFEGALRPGWVERQVAWLAEARRLGARGLKIYKDFGLHVRDPVGRRITVDDARLDPIFEAAGQLGLPVAIHVGDPKAFFEPIDPRNERLAELTLNPQWSFADRARYPPWEALFGEFIRLVERHPHTTFIGVHFGNDPEEPERVAELLDRLPNLLVDTAARIGEIGRMPAPRLRQIFVSHKTRILFGTDIAVSADDLTLGAPEPYPETPGTVSQFFDAHWLFFESSQKGLAHPTPIQGAWTVDGLGLPRDVLEAVYHGNAERLFGS